MWMVDSPDANTLPLSTSTALVAQAHAVRGSRGFTRAIGSCELMENPVDYSGSAVNFSSPLKTVNNYFFLKEKRNLPLTGKVQLLKEPQHGELSRLFQAETEWEFRYVPDADYFGPDQATFQVDIAGERVKLVYFFNVMNRVPGGTEGYDPYRDKKLCPKGAYWRIGKNSETASMLPDVPSLPPQNLPAIVMQIAAAGKSAASKAPETCYVVLHEKPAPAFNSFSPVWDFHTELLKHLCLLHRNMDVYLRLVVTRSNRRRQHGFTKSPKQPAIKS